MAVVGGIAHTFPEMEYAEMLKYKVVGCMIHNNKLRYVVRACAFAVVLAFFGGLLFPPLAAENSPESEDSPAASLVKKGQNHFMKMYRINEPLQISGEDGGHYFLPTGTVLYLEKSFDEGHDLYWTPFFHKGRIDATEVHLEPKHQGRLVVPQWLNNLDGMQLKELFSAFPLTTSDIKAAVRANQLTREDLLEIIRSMPE